MTPFFRVCVGILVIISLIVIAILSVRLRSLQSENLNLAERIRVLEERGMSSAQAAPPTHEVRLEPGIIPPQKQPSSESRPVNQREQNMPFPQSEWRAMRNINRIERYAVISDSEREALKTALQENTNVDLESEQLKNILSEILGADRAQKILTQHTETEQREQQQRVEVEAVMYRRKLQLSDQQEEAVRQALATVNADMRQSMRQFRDKMAEAGSLHEQGDSARDQLRNNYDQLRQLSQEMNAMRSERLQSILKPQLDEQQFNALLEYEATKNSRGFPGF